MVPLPFLEAAYRPGALLGFIAAGVAQALLVAGAASFLSRPVATAPASHEGAPRVAAALLLASWAVASLALNMGDPPHGDAWLSTLADQRFRYAALVVGCLVSYGGCALLAGLLHRTGQVALGSLGFASNVVSTVLFTLLFLAHPLLTTVRFEQEGVAAPPVAWWATYAAFLSAAGLVQRLGAHTSAVLLALGSQRAGLIGVGPMRVIAGVALLAGIGGLFVHVPPAVAFLPPYFLGVSVLARTREPAV
jgi:hypothetical protein